MLFLTVNNYLLLHFIMCIYITTLISYLLACHNEYTCMNARMKNIYYTISKIILHAKKFILKNCHNEIYHMCDIDIGIPQGSALGPILFILYANGINRHVHIGAACNLYADDTLVYCCANNVDTLQECTHNYIACIKQWYDMNKLVIDTAKSNVNDVSSMQHHVLSVASKLTVLITLELVGCTSNLE